MAMPPDMTEQDFEVMKKKCPEIIVYLKEALNLFRKTNTDVKYLDDLIISAISVFMVEELVRVSLEHKKSVFTGHFMLQHSMNNNLLSILNEKGIFE